MSVTDRVSDGDERATQPRPPSLHHRAVFIRIFGILGSVPTVGLNLPAAIPLALVSLTLRRGTPWPPWTKLLVGWALVGCAALVASGLLNGQELATSSIGQFAMCALFLAAYRVVVTDFRQAARLIGWLSGTLAIYYVFLGPENTRTGFEALWKYGLAYPLTIAVVYAIVRVSSNRVWPVAVLVLLGAMGTILDYRSYGLVCFAAAAISLAKGRGRGSAWKTLVFGGGALLALAIVLPQAMAAGVFGSAVQTRTLIQSGQGASLLLGGRTEPPLSIAAIAERPIVGWGNVQGIDQLTIRAGVEIAQNLGMGSPSNYLPLWIREEGRISLHSVFFVSWVEGGVLAAVFPLLLVALFSVAAVRATGQFAPLVALVCAQGVWDVMFSPWAVNKSVVVAASVVLASMALVEASRGARSLKTDRELNLATSIRPALSTEKARPRASR